MWDEEGKRYIDFFAGAGALNYGHNPPELRDKLVSYIQSSSVTHGLDLHTRAKKEFLEVFESLILKPRNFPHKIMFSGPTGANAVESAIKIARLATGRKNIASFTNGFHGMTLGALAATGNKYNRAGAGSSLSHVDRYPFDGYFNTADVDTVELIDKLINDPSSGFEPPAAFLLETVQAEGGINVASGEWLEKLAGLAKKVGSLLIVDDIQVGCGRTGKFFSFDNTNIEPDIITLSKSISAYGLPMSVVLVKPEYDLFMPGQHNGTFRGNNLAFVTAKDALLRYWSDDGFAHAVSEKSLKVSERLHKIQQMCGDGFSVRGQGMIQGLVTPNSTVAEAIVAESFRQGLIVETCGPNGEVLKMLSALNIPDDVLNEGMDILAKSAVAACEAVDDRVVA